ncbi:MAG: TolC family protein [Kofleriaceae bacterium]|nr:TolC family protein [Kofleriaceae bacterium]
MYRVPFVLLAALVACVPSRSELRSPVDADLAKRLGAPAIVDGSNAQVAALLERPIDRENAVKIALANNPRLRAAFADLGIAGGEFAEAIGLGPLDVGLDLRFGGKTPEGNRLYEVELDVVQNLIGLVTAPRLRAAARADLAAARATAAATALRLAGKVEMAFHDLIAAQQELELRRTAFDAADAAATVRERMHDAGNTSDLAQARDRDAREQARVDLGRAEANVEVAREQLNALLGLSGDQTKWTAAGTLADLPAAAPALDDLETAAVAASLDLKSGTSSVEGAANRAGAEGLRAFLPDFGVGVSVVNHGAGLEIGPALRFGFPLFDQRAGQRARANARLARAEHERTAIAVELRANARATRITALAAYQEARHLRDVVLPLRQQIVDQTLLHYNAMDANPFELIVARRQLADAGHQYLDALRRYWNATSEVLALRRGVSLGAVAPIPMGGDAADEPSTH